MPNAVEGKAELSQTMASAVDDPQPTAPTQIGDLKVIALASASQIIEPLALGLLRLGPGEDEPFVAGTNLSCYDVIAPTRGKPCSANRGARNGVPCAAGIDDIINPYRGLPLVAIPGIKLEPGSGRTAGRSQIPISAGVRSLPDDYLAK